MGPLNENLILKRRGTSASGLSHSSVSSKLLRLNVRSQISAQSVGGVDGEEADANANRVAFILRSSLAVNCMLFVSKLYAFITTGSLAVLASLVDSTIDLAAQSALIGAHYVAENSKRGNQVDTIYPVGMSRVEPLGVIICAVLMVLAAAEVVRRSCSELIVYFGSTSGPEMEFDIHSAELLIAVIFLKIGLWQWCVNASRIISNVSLEAVSLDNWNDVVSNVAALLAAALTKLSPDLWMSDPVGAILISAYIIWAWIKTSIEQVDMLVGRQASPEFLAMIREIAETHDPQAQLDVVRAYHFGPKFLVEVEMVMDRKTPLQVSHDVGMLLQDRIERLEECERCFVHIDYAFRPNDDHDQSVSITQKISADRIGSHIA